MTKTITPNGETIGAAAMRSDVPLVVKTREPKEIIDNTDALKGAGLRIRHVLPAGFEGADGYFRRGMTIAYRQANKSVLEVATAVCHSQDQFTKKMGTKLAIENFLSGHTIYIPMLQGATPQQTINAMIGAE